jgi:putative flippase GtrA
MIHLFRQFSFFVVVGIIATGVHYAVLIALVEIAGLSAVAAALAGYSAGGTVSYTLNRRHVFRSNAPHELAASRFVIVAAVGFALTYFFMSLLVHKARLPYLPAQVVTTGIVMLWNFAAHRTWTFSPQLSPPDSAAGRDSRPPGERRQRR